MNTPHPWISLDPQRYPSDLFCHINLHREEEQRLTEAPWVKAVPCEDRRNALLS